MDKGKIFCCFFCLEHSGWELYIILFVENSQFTDLSCDFWEVSDSGSSDSAEKEVISDVNVNEDSLSSWSEAEVLSLSRLIFEVAKQIMLLYTVKVQDR